MQVPEAGEELCRCHGGKLRYFCLLSVHRLTLLGLWQLQFASDIPRHIALEDAFRTALGQNSRR